LTKKSNLPNKQTKKTRITNLLQSDSEEEIDTYHNKITKANKRQRNDEIYEDFNDGRKLPNISTRNQMYNMSDILLESPFLNETSNIMNSKIMPDKEKSNV
ncbi:1419_t:CDS:2, partial [Funneliformis geosporum]